MYSFIKDEGIEKLCENVDNKFAIIDKRVDDIFQQLGNLAETYEKKKEKKEELKEENHEAKVPNAGPAKVNKKKKKTSKHQVAWVGTSLSKGLNKNKFEKDLDVELTFVKAYCIKEEGRYPKSNFEAIVPETMRNGSIDTLVLETGSIEITNIDVNRAMMNTERDISEYKNEWFEKMEEASKSLFKIAEDCVQKDENLQVIIVKRPQRFDRSSQDILGIKPKLSEYANKVYDQCLLKTSKPGNIHLVELDLIQNSSHLKQIVYGHQKDDNYDGIHFVGAGSSRHLTYRAIQSISKVIRKPNQTKKLNSFSRARVLPARKKPQQTNHSNNNYSQTNQGQSARAGHSGRSDRFYSDVLKGNSTKNTDYSYLFLLKTSTTR